jgi:hypothetical protein
MQLKERLSKYKHVLSRALERVTKRLKTVRPTAVIRVHFAEMRVQPAEKVEDVKINCALLSHARHSFMTIVNGEWIAINQMTITGKCVIMKAINSILIGI